MKATDHTSKLEKYLLALGQMRSYKGQCFYSLWSVVWRKTYYEILNCLTSVTFSRKWTRLLLVANGSRAIDVCSHDFVNISHAM